MNIEEGVDVASNQLYCVHLQFIDEKLGGPGGNRDRFMIYHTQQEVSGINLHRGIQLIIPSEVTGYDLYTDMRNGNKPRYWEILVEKKKWIPLVSLSDRSGR